MKYFKNTELAKIYNVSEKSVRNWIQAARSGKLDLQLYEHNGRLAIANITKNTETIKKLAENGKKYKNSRGYKVICPSEKFYKTFNKTQLLDIIASISSRNELPLKYSYLDGGATYWDQYVKRLSEEASPNMLNRTIDLIDINTKYLDEFLENKKVVRIIDIGAGNGLPAKPLIQHLLNMGKECHYIAIDISQNMLDIVGRNIYSWFDGKVKFDSFARDVEYERFNDLLTSSYRKDGTEIANIVLVLGGTLNNLRVPTYSLLTIAGSMGAKDLLIYTTKLDTETTRRFFDFNISSGMQELTPRHRLALDLMNITPDMYRVEQSFDTKKKARVIGIRLETALQINFAEHDPSLQNVELNKDDTITLWRFWHQDTKTISEQFEDCGLDTKVLTKSVDDDYVCVLARISKN